MRRIDYLIMDIASFLWIEKLLTRNQKKCYNYCDYKSICGFNMGGCENKYNYIDKKSKEEILSKIGQ